jgi:hypothetical protein
VLRKSEILGGRSDSREWGLRRCHGAGLEMKKGVV